MNISKILLAILFFSNQLFSQKKVAITIDDVPNSPLYNNENFKHRLLDKIDSMHLPVAIFINEQRIFYADSISKNMNLFNDWIKDVNVTLGNHGFSHAMYSAIGIDSLKTEVLKGETITKELAKKYNKKENYFRFPYNDLGADEQQHQEAADFLTTHHYTLTPFTVHSEDWLVTQLYEYYKAHNMSSDAARIGNAFIEKTMAYFDYIETLTSKKQNRDVSQVYLMHDNLLNADYLDKLIGALRNKGYSFISLDEAMSDPLYKQKDHFQQREGISWVYRWIDDKNVRKKLMIKGPNENEFEKELNSLKK